MYFGKLFSTKKENKEQATARRQDSVKSEHPIKSLFYNYKNIEDISRSEIDAKNTQKILEPLYSFTGPKNLLTKEEIESINLRADRKLAELEKLGKSRE